MTTPWDGDEYENGSSGAGPGGGRIAVATKKDTDPVEVYWRSDTGSGTWSTPPVFVATVDAAEHSILFRTHYDGINVWIENGEDKIWLSANGGVAGSWAPY